MHILFRLSFACLFLGGLLFRCDSNQRPGKTISPEEVYRIVYDSVEVSKYIVLDTRSRMDYIRGHLVSAYWLSPDSILQKLPLMMKEKRPFIIYDADETRIAAVTNVLLESGITNVYVMRGGFLRWMQLEYPAAIQLVRNTTEKIDAQPKYVSIAAAQGLVNNLISKTVLIDVRAYPAFADAHIESAISIPYVPLNEFVVGIEEQNFARNRPIILYCDSGSDIGEKAMDVMLRNDFTQVYLLRCDVDAWNSALADIP